LWLHAWDFMMRGMRSSEDWMTSFDGVRRLVLARACSSAAVPGPRASCSPFNDGVEK
jgi:hypothetical protein